MVQYDCGGQVEQIGGIGHSRVSAWVTKVRSVSWVGELPAWFFAAWATALVVQRHWPYLMTPVPQCVDEGYIMALGQRLLHGRMLPYVDGAAHTGPVFIYSGALLAAFGEFNWMPIRIAAALGSALVSVFAFACGVAAKRPLLGAIAAAGMPFYVFMTLNNIDALSYNAELPAIMFALAGFAAAVRATDSDARPISSGWLFTAGLLTSLTLLTKQIAALLALAIAAYALVGVLAREDLTRRAQRRAMLFFVAGGALPALLIFGRIAVGGALDEAFYYLVTYNRYPYMDIYRDMPLRQAYDQWLAARPLELALLAVSIVWAFMQLLVARENTRSWWLALVQSRFHWTVALLAIGGIVGARASRREYDHYYLMVVPGCSLLMGLLFEHALMQLRRPSYRLASHALILAPLVYTGQVAVKSRNQHPTAWQLDDNYLADLPTAHKPPRVCKYIHEHVKPDEKLFVWGFRPELYVSCGRLPATRYVFTTFVSGYVPGSWAPFSKEVDDARASPGARERVVRELEETKPPVLVECTHSLGGRSFHDAGPLWDYIQKHYRHVRTINHDAVWLRWKPGDKNAPPDVEP
ncbi:MAG TPA: hypothetical protein VI299_14315 [Polyangiales bacterium]